MTQKVLKNKEEILYRIIKKLKKCNKAGNSFLSVDRAVAIDYR